MDVYSAKKRSWLMSRVKGKNTRPELLVRSRMFREGFRFRIHVGALPGKPDIVLRRYRTVVFVHGCFWHGHSNCGRAQLPIQNRRFWKAKISDNVKRDTACKAELRRLGWKIQVVWTCDLRSPEIAETSLRRLSRVIRNS
jgi:DNA mismatch endonuclease, patch repair protein